MTDTSFSDSYIATDTILEALIGADPRAGAVALKAAAAASQEWYCQEATRAIDMLRLRGTKYEYDQDRAFPRIIDGAVVGDADQNAVVPEEVERACMEEAVALYEHYASTSSQQRANLQEQGVTSYSIGKLSETFGASGSGKMHGLKSVAAYRILSRFIAHTVPII